MSELNEILNTLQNHKETLAKNYSVKTVGVFGSYCKGVQTANSDLDILIELSQPIGLLKYVSLEDEIGKFTGKKVDLVMKSALKHTIGKRILNEVVYA
ncbi:MAG: nucleotidyltransferase family protein [Elusimicrobiota bacterium]|jgi:predicted nucleotidyltransferase|nr:nucleotidyltransferase family protein [Elusimicrobiota bacterium]